MLTLYQFEGSPWCWKVRIVLAEKKLEYRTVTPVNRENDPKFRALTPVGKVPVLVLEDGTPIYESTVINEYLQDRYPVPSLLPNDPADRARVRMMEEVCDAYLAPALRQMVRARYRFDAGRLHRLPSVDVEQEAEGLRTARPYLEAIDRELQGQDYLVSEFSLADIALVPPVARSARLLDLPLQKDWPDIARWLDSVLKRPSVAGTAPPPYRIVEA